MNMTERKYWEYINMIYFFLCLLHIVRDIDGPQRPLPPENTAAA
jgi:hypothetical protein